MKTTFKAVLIVLTFAVLLFLGSLLSRHPFSLFVLREEAGRVEAFQVLLPLSRQEPTVTNLKLSGDQKKQAVGMLKAGDSQVLRSFAATFGKFDAVCGIGGDKQEDSWPSYMGGGSTALFQEPAAGEFDDLTWFDRAYLSLATQVPPAAPFVEDLPTVTTTASMAATPAPTAGIVPQASPVPATGVVRVEILNGCGITGAADWAARRFQGRGVTIVSTGNADNFHYPKTIVRTAAGVPVALEEAVQRLGLTKDSIEEVPTAPDSMDAVVIVGRDYHGLKRHKR